MVSAILLAGGSGHRMNSDKAKQYIEVGGVPLIVHALRAFEKSVADSIVLVVRAGDEAYVRTEIVEKYELHKVAAIVPGGRERFDSVWEGIRAVRSIREGGSMGGTTSAKAGATSNGSEARDAEAPTEDIVLIHDGARPFVTPDMIHASVEAARQYGACTVAVPVKDTIKVVDAMGFGIDTPDRATLYQVQTPQTFLLPLIEEAHQRFREEPRQGITDDTMLVEEYLGRKCRIVPGSYENLKVTTPEDIVLAEALLSK